MKPVRTHPELAYELGNLATLCSRCHIEVGRDEADPRRDAWRSLVRDLQSPSRKDSQCLSQ